MYAIKQLKLYAPYNQYLKYEFKYYICVCLCVRQIITFLKQKFLLKELRTIFIYYISYISFL